MSCTNTCLSMSYDGGNEFYAEKFHRAAKPHRCCECAEPIAIGERYQRAVGKYEGSIFTQDTCADCAEIRAAFCCNGWSFTQLWESVRDQLFRRWRHDDVCMIDCLAKLTTDGATAKVRAEYADYLIELDS